MSAVPKPVRTPTAPAPQPEPDPVPPTAWRGDVIALGVWVAGALLLASLLLKDLVLALVTR
jgi:hypothetical protein